MPTYLKTFKNQRELWKMLAWDKMTANDLLKLDLGLLRF